MDASEARRYWPGYLATGLMILITMAWTYWGVAEMVHEGWWGSWLNRLLYLIPGGAWLLTLIAIRWPRFIFYSHFCPYHPIFTPSNRVG